MNDEIIKQLVLRLKVEGQDEVQKITQSLVKNTETSARAFPVREMGDLLRISEKVGGEFKKVTDELKTLRLTNLKAEVKDVNSMIETMLGNLKRAREQGNARAEAFLMGRIGGAAQQGMEAERQIAGMQTPSLMSRMGGRAMVGAAAGAFASQAYETYGQYRRVSAEQSGKDINARLDSIQQLMQPITREQDLYYSGNMTRLSLEREQNTRARETARAQIQMERQQLEARVQESTGGIGRRALQGMATGAAGGGIFGAMFGGAGAAPGALIGGGLGLMGGAASAFFEQYGARRELQRYQQNQQGRYAQLFTQNRQKLAAEPMEPVLRAMEEQAIPMERMRQTYGGDIGQLTGEGEAGFQSFSEQEIRQMIPGIAGRTGGFRGRRIATQAAQLKDQGYQGETDTMTRLMTAMSRQGGTANVADTMKQFQQAQTATGNVPFQEGLNRSLAATLETSRVRLNPGRVGQRQGYIAGQAAAGEDPQMKLSAFNQVMAIPDFMRSSGTMENQLYRSNIRDIIFKSGKSGGEAAALENMLSSMDINELQSPQVQGMLHGMGIDAHKVLKARVHSTEQRLNTILPKDMVQKLKKGGFKSEKEANDFFRRAAMIETGGTMVNPEALEMEARKLRTELMPNLKARSRGPLSEEGMGGMTAADRANQAMARAKLTATSQPLREGRRLTTEESPEGEKFRNLQQQGINAGAQPPSTTGGAFGGEIDDVKTALDAFVTAVNGATTQLGGVPPGQGTVQSGAANAKGP